MKEEELRSLLLSSLDAGNFILDCSAFSKSPDLVSMVRDYFSEDAVLHFTAASVEGLCVSGNGVSMPWVADDDEDDAMEQERKVRCSMRIECDFWIDADEHAQMKLGEDGFLAAGRVRIDESKPRTVELNSTIVCRETEDDVTDEYCEMHWKISFIFEEEPQQLQWLPWKARGVPHSVDFSGTMILGNGGNSFCELDWRSAPLGFPLHFGFRNDLNANQSCYFKITSEMGHNPYRSDVTTFCWLHTELRFDEIPALPLKAPIGTSVLRFHVCAEPPVNARVSLDFLKNFGVTEPASQLDFGPVPLELINSDLQLKGVVIDIDRSARETQPSARRVSIEFNFDPSTCWRCTFPTMLKPFEFTELTMNVIVFRPNGRLMKSVQGRCKRSADEDYVLSYTCHNDHHEICVQEFDSIESSCTLRHLVNLFVENVNTPAFVLHEFSITYYPVSHGSDEREEEILDIRAEVQGDSDFEVFSWCGGGVHIGSVYVTYEEAELTAHGLLFFASAEQHGITASGKIFEGGWRWTALGENCSVPIESILSAVGVPDTALNFKSSEDWRSMSTKSIEAIFYSARNEFTVVLGLPPPSVRQVTLKQCNDCWEASFDISPAELHFLALRLVRAARLVLVCFRAIFDSLVLRKVATVLWLDELSSHVRDGVEGFTETKRMRILSFALGSLSVPLANNREQFHEMIENLMK